MDGEVAIQPEGAEQPFIYRGFQMVDEEKLRELRGDELRKMNQNGMLPLIYRAPVLAVADPRGVRAPGAAGQGPGPAAPRAGHGRRVIRRGGPSRSIETARLPHIWVMPRRFAAPLRATAGARTSVRSSLNFRPSRQCRGGRFLFGGGRDGAVEQRLAEADGERFDQRAMRSKPGPAVRPSRRDRAPVDFELERVDAARRAGRAARRYGRRQGIVERRAEARGAGDPRRLGADPGRGAACRGGRRTRSAALPARRRRHRMAVEQQRAAEARRRSASSCRSISAS